MYTPFIDPKGKIQHLSDGIHPNAEGYEMMATIWFKAIKASLQ